MLTIALVRWTDRVSSACRVAYSLGADRVLLVDSVEPKIRHLQTAKRLQIDKGFLPDDAVLLEVNGEKICESIEELRKCCCIAVGGSSFTFPQSHHKRIAIPYRKPCLIGDQAIAVALYARGLPC